MKQWYLLYCKRGEQQRARLNLENQNIECYYPEVEVEKIIRGKRQKKLEPLFPSYMFIHFDPEEGPSCTSVRSTRGVIDFVRRGAMPQVVNRGLISKLMQLRTEEDELTNLPKQGDIVRILEGQFAGVDAIYQQPDGERRSIMLIKLINTCVEVSLENEHVAFG